MTSATRPTVSRSIPLFKVALPAEEVLLPRLRDVLYSGYVGEGQAVVDFEAAFSKFIGAERVLSCSSGTAALHLALILANVQSGDEVISTAMTAEPTNMAILHAGGRIVWADVDPWNGNLSAESVAGRITARTRAIMAVHYGGIPVALRAIRAVAEAYGIPVIEDAAHALGARYGGQLLGGHSEFVMFSFQAIKHFTTVDGGMLVCRSATDLQRGRLVRWFGIDRTQPRTELDVAIVGYKYHMNNVNATIGLVHLPYLESLIERHIANGRFFDRVLRDIPGLDVCRWDAEAEPSYWFYTVLADRRDDFMAHLRSHGVDSSTVHKRNDLHSVFAGSKCDLPGLDAFYARMAHIPCGWWVTDEDREYIVDVIKRGW